MNNNYFNITAVKKQSELFIRLRLELSGLSVIFCQASRLEILDNRSSYSFSALASRR